MIHSMEEKKIWYDAETHAYYLVQENGEFRIPSVTQILQGIGFIDKRYFKPEDAERGRLIHRLARIVEMHPHTIPRIHAAYQEYLAEEQQNMDGWMRAWVRFLEESGWESETIEIPRVHSSELFAGRVDRTGYLRDLKMARKQFVGTDELVVLDLKTGHYQDWHMLQLEAYRLMVREENPEKKVRKMALYLRPNGRYTLRDFPGEIGKTWMKAVYAYYEFRREE